MSIVISTLVIKTRKKTWQQLGLVRVGSNPFDSSVVHHDLLVEGTLRKYNTEFCLGINKEFYCNCNLIFYM